MNEYLEVLRQQEAFHKVIEYVKGQKPVVPMYDHISDNTDDWKAKSNMLKGFNLALILLGEADE